MSQKDFNTKAFIKDYWQQKPLVIRNFFPDFEDPIDEHELAGLAQEAEVDSRIVQNFQGRWQTFQGPFDDFTPYCKGKWSLLVQAVDRYIPEVDELLSAVSFLPAWRIDDVMISYSVKGAGVGAHIDEYDVFIVQGKGARRWKVGEKGNYPKDKDSGDLVLIKDFNPIIDEVLNAGDAIYIPPHFPHSGITIEDCLNYSLGFRAPDFTSLFNELTDQLLSQNKSIARYQDKNSLIGRTAASAMLTSKEINSIKDYLIEQIKAEEFNELIALALSKQHLINDKIEEYTVDSLKRELSACSSLVKSPGVKAIYTQAKAKNGFTFYIDGEKYKVDERCAPAFINWCNNGVLTIDTECKHDLNQSELATQALLKMLNSQHAYLA